MAPAAAGARPAPVRPLRLLALGGTIAMSADPARPMLDARALLAGLSNEAVAGVEVETAALVASSQLSLEDALRHARRARDLAAGGSGVVVTIGTDTLEEIAMLIDLLHGPGPAPIAITGANRLASAPGADGPANVLDAIAVAGAAAAEGLGAVVVFAGEIHAAAQVAKVDSTGPAAFASPASGPLGRVIDGRLWLAARPRRRAALDVQQLTARVPIVTAALAEDGAMVEAALALGADGLVASVLGAGHAPPAMAAALADAAQRIPVVLVCRPLRGAMLYGSHAFEGSERDLRATAAIPAPFLTAPAARMKLLAALGAGLTLAAMRELFGGDDAA